MSIKDKFSATKEEPELSEAEKLKQAIDEFSQAYIKLNKTIQEVWASPECIAVENDKEQDAFVQNSPAYTDAAEKYNKTVDELTELINNDKAENVFVLGKTPAEFDKYEQPTSEKPFLFAISVDNNFFIVETYGQDISVKAADREKIIDTFQTFNPKVTTKEVARMLHFIDKNEEQIKINDNFTL